MTKTVKTMVVVALVGSSLMGDAMSGMYIGVGVAHEKGGSSDGSYDAGKALVLTAGMPLPKDTFIDNMYAEAELTQTIDAHTASGTYYSAEAKYTTVGFYGAYKYDINKDWYVKPRIGLLYAKTSVSIDVSSSFYSASSSMDETSFDMAYSVVGGYKLNKNVDITFGFNNADFVPFDSLYQFTVGANYNF